MKALEILKGHLSACNEMGISGEDYKEAIAELEAMNLTRREWYQKGFNEAMKPKTCEGCKYQKIDIDRCDFCKRYYSDQYEPKDNA
ncbi:MAG: hypothetical protein ACMV1K_00160 [Sulfurospirillum sp.]